MAKSSPVPSAKSAREQRVDGGVALLQRALHDLVRQGLARAVDDGLLDELARRLVDAQAPGLANAVSRLALVSDLEVLVLGLGRLQLLCDAWSARERLDPALQADVRAALGIALTAAKVKAEGEVVSDLWAVIGQAIEVDELRDLHTTRTWLRGLRHGRTALHLAFVGGFVPSARRAYARAAAGSHAGPNEVGSPGSPGSPGSDVDPNDAPLEVGTRFEGALAFWPSAAPQRALVVDRGPAEPLQTSRLPGRGGVADTLGAWAALLGKQPFAWRTVTIFGDVRVAFEGEGRGQIVDGDVALPLASAHLLELLALTGGHACDLVCEWDGRELRPLAVQRGAELVALEVA